MSTRSDTPVQRTLLSAVGARIAGTYRRGLKAMERAIVERRSLQSLHRWRVSGELAGETAAVAAGKVRYAQDHGSDQKSYFQLRRNIHRLEKGLIMRPRRPAFAADYIGTTVKLYGRAVTAQGQDGASHPEMIWARDVLDSYFSTVDTSSPRIGAAQAAYRRVSVEQPGRPLVAIPYARDLSTAPVDFEAFMGLSRRRRSVRWYLDAPVSRDLLDQAVTAAGQAPSACNRQPFTFRIFDDKEKARRIASIPAGTKGFAEHLPAVIVVVGRLRAYPLERDRHAIYVDGSLAAMSLLFALETLGLASCPINWPDVASLEARMKHELQLEDDERVIMLIATGWPDPEGLVPYSAKRPLDELRRYG